MNKLTHKVSVSALIVVALSFAYYFLYFLPQTRSEETLVKRQQDCSKLAIEATEAHQTYNSSSDLVSYSAPTNHYNKKLGKCIVEISYSYNAGLAHSKEIVMDAVEHDILTQCDEIISQDGKDLTRCTVAGEAITYDEFANLRDRYLSE